MFAPRHPLLPSFRSKLRLGGIIVCAFAITAWPGSARAQPLLPSAPPPANSIPLGPSAPGPAPIAMPPGMAMPNGAPSAASGPDIHDLHSLVPLTFWERHGTEVIIAGIATAIILGLILGLLLRKKPQPPLTPIQRARQELAAAHALLVTGQDKAFAIAVSNAVRHYLENAYRLPAPERTTEEFLQETARHDWLQGELTTLLRRFLELCDLAKFAGQQFGPTEREQLHAAASEFVEAAERHLHPPASASGKNPSDDADAGDAPAPPTARDLARNLEKVSPH